MVNPNFLKSLIAIADDGSFRAAARRLGLSQSGISMQMRSLENDLAMALFDRSRKPPRLTAQGHAVIREARTILAAYATIETMAQEQGPLSGSLALGVIPTASTRLMPDALLLLARDYPLVHIQLESGLSDELVAGVDHGRLDAAVVTEPPQLDNGLTSWLIEEELLVLIDAVDGGRTLEFGALAERPFIQFKRQAGVGQVIEALLSSLEISPKSFMELDSIDAILTMVAKGLGVAIVPQASILPHFSKRVRRMPLDHELARRRISLITRTGHGKVRLIGALTEALRHITSTNIDI